MSIFWILFLTVGVSSYLEIWKKNKNEKIGRILLIINLCFITLLLMFRYGEGSDYPNYESIYNSFGQAENFLSAAISWGYTREIGFFFLNWIMARVGLPFQALLIVIAIAEAPLVYGFLDRYCRGFRCTGLLLLIPSYFFIYQMSALREGLIIAIFLGVLLPLQEKRKWFCYYLIAALCLLIHSLAVVYLLCPLVIRIHERILEVISIAAASVSIVVRLILFLLKDPRGGDLFGMMLRILMLGAVCVAFHFIKTDGFSKQLFQIFAFGEIIYFGLIWINSFAASRTFETVRAVGIAVVVTALGRCGKKLVLFWNTIFLLYAGAVFSKNLDMRIKSGLKDFVRVYNYPYVTIFQKEKIDDYRIDLYD